MLASDAIRPLIILGNGVHAREMAQIAARMNADRPRFELIGHIFGQAPDTPIAGCPYLGTRDVLERYPNALLVPDNEWPRPIDIARERFVSLVDPSVFVATAAAIGVGSVIYPGCFVGHKAKIGDFVFMLSNCIVNHDDVLDDHVVLASSVTLAGSVHVESGAYLGQSCSIRQFTRVGRGALVGMGSIVIRDVEPNAVVAGNPARKLRDHVATRGEPL